jgi:hypothetical protein
LPWAFLLEKRSNLSRVCIANMLPQFANASAGLVTIPAPQGGR